MAGKIVSFVNQKGGVGKTTLSMLTADVLHKAGNRVMVVDTDPQRSAQKWESKSLEDYPAFPVRVEAVSGLSPRLFAQWLEKRSESIDFFVIDTPPNLNSLELRTALYIADVVVLPFTAHGSSVDALEEVIPLIQDVETERGSKIEVRVLLNRVDLRRASEKAIVENAARICPWPVMKAQLKNLAALADAYNYRTSIYSLPGGKDAKAALERVVQEICK